jgi:mono/diheme cytochrome c family protein
VARRSWLTALVLLSACAGAPDPTALAPCPPPPDANVLAALDGQVGPSDGDAARGSEVFAAECARCHAARIVERDSRLFHDYPRLDCPATAASPPAYLELAIAEGGLAIGRDKLMKPFAETLSSAQIADVVAYLLAGAR